MTLTARNTLRPHPLTQFIDDQAEAFLDFWPRAGLPFDQAFRWWAESKDFEPTDRRAIYREVCWRTRRPRSDP